MEASGVTSPPHKRAKTDESAGVGTVPVPASVPAVNEVNEINAGVVTEALPAAEPPLVAPVPAPTTIPVTVPTISAKTAAGVPVPALQIQKLSDKGRLPTRGSALAAGYDLYAAKETIVPARGKVLVSTDIAIAVPLGTYGRIAPRSGLAAKHYIDTGAGVIDADYRGEVKVLLFNHNETDFAIQEGDRIAQLILERIVTPDVIEVAVLNSSDRGAGGFGSTGIALVPQPPVA